MACLQNVLSIDVEDWFQVEAFANLIPRESWTSLDSRVRRNTEILLELLHQKGVRATFFTLGSVAEREPDLIRSIARQGHEVASHGCSHRALWNLDPASFAEEARRSKAILEDLTGTPVLGFRCPTFSIKKETLWALDVLAACGYEYDSSIFPVHHDRYGIPDSPLDIHLTPSGVWELPMSVLELGRYRLPVAGGGYFRIFPLALTSHALRTMNKAGRPGLVYLHPWEFDKNHPRYPGMNLQTRFRHYFGISANKAKLDALLDQFAFAPARDVLHGLQAFPRVAFQNRT